MKRFEIQNVKCGGCANTLKAKLEPIFGKIDIDLSVEPRVISILNNKVDEEKLRNKLIKLGYPMIDERLNIAQNIATKTKSFVSCAIGKLD